MNNSTATHPGGVNRGIPTSSGPYAWLLLLWLFFLARGVFYCSVYPLWEGFDEWAHFAVLDHISVTGEILVDRNMRVSTEVNSSLQLAPLPRGMTGMVPPEVERATYGKLSSDERVHRESALHNLQAGGTEDSVHSDIPAYEASQPPLYYWLMAMILRPFRQLSLLDRVWLARVITFAIGSFAIPIGFFLVRKFFPTDAIALGVTALVVVMPELTIDLARVSNESLSILLFTSLLLAICDWIERPQSVSRTMTVGLLLGLGLLTKAYFLTAIPALGLLFLWLYWTEPQKRRFQLRCAASTSIISLTIGGWWYLRNIFQTGTVSGLDEALMVRGVGFTEKIRAAAHVQWIEAIATVLLSHIWYGGWSLLALPRTIYYVCFAMVIVGLCGLLKSGKTWTDPKRFCLLSFYLWFWLGQGYQIVMLFLSKSSSTAMGGWYLYSVVWAEVILWIIGIFALLPVRFQKTVLILLISSTAALDLYAVHFISLPYYANVTSLLDVHLIPLLIDKPPFITARTLVFLWAAYVCSTGLTVVTAASALRLDYFFKFVESDQNHGIADS